MGLAMRGLENSVPSLRVAAESASLLGYFPPRAQLWTPFRPPQDLVDQAMTVLQVIAALLCLLVLSSLFRSEGLSSHASEIYLLLAISAVLMGISAVQSVRRNRREKLFHETVERVARAAQAANVGLWGWKPAGDQFWATPTGLKILGLPDTGLTLLQVIDRLHPDDQDRLRDMIAEVAHSQEERECECRQVRESGIGWVRFSMSGAAHAAGDDQVAGCVTDITGQRQMEAEISSQRRSLAHLTRVGLLGQLGGALAHELKQPLTAILSNAQALQRLIEHKNADMQEIRAVIADIIQDDSRAAAVIQHLRSLLKPDEFRSQLLDLNEVVRDTLELVHNEMISRRVAVSTALSDAPLRVAGDPIQLQQLLLNLIFNAADAMAGNKGGMMLIATDLIEGPAAHLTVTDTGQGIKQDVMDRLFEPFVSTKTHGVGLGLSISRAIVLSHKGRVWAHNNPGRGATFHVSLPLAEPS
jgi:C4-dicarboxylate-specific signal transduction histidine kinase